MFSRLDAESSLYLGDDARKAVILTGNKPINPATRLQSFTDLSHCPQVSII